MDAGVEAVKLPLYARLKGITKVPLDTPHADGPDPICWTTEPGSEVPDIAAKCRHLCGPPEIDNGRERIQGLWVRKGRRYFVHRDDGLSTTASYMHFDSYLLYGTPELRWKKEVVSKAPKVHKLEGSPEWHTLTAEQQAWIKDNCPDVDIDAAISMMSIRGV